MNSPALTASSLARSSLQRAGWGKVVKDIQLTIPTPYPLQAEIVADPRKRKVICAGRRVGKTITAAGIALGGDLWGNNGLLNGKRVLLSSTSQNQADIFWDYIKDWTTPLQRHGLYKNETRRIIRYNGGQIQVKTGSKPDALRSMTADVVVLDECAFLEADAWHKVVAPMLADTLGTAIFISTPNRRNWFFQLYVNALQKAEEWATWNFATTENPYLTAEALRRLVADMTEDDYEQEILAKFLEGQGAVFRKLNEAATGQRETPQPGHEYVFGVDWAQSKDFTVILVMDSTTKRMVDYDRFNGISWSLQREHIITMNDRWKPIAIYAEHNSIGGPNIEALQAEGLPVHSFETTAKSKPPLIESLVLAFERNEIVIIKDAILMAELMAYERKVSETTGRSQYSAPEGIHDDFVMALALAWFGVVKGVTADEMQRWGRNEIDYSKIPEHLIRALRDSGEKI